MADWKEYKLGDIATVVDCEHKTAPIVDTSEYISVRTTDISNGKIDYQKANRVSFETYTEWTKRLVPKEGDIILAREAPVGEVGWISKNRKVCLGQRTVLLRPHNENIYPQYLLYYLANPATKSELINRSTGSVVEHLNVKDIRGFELKIPSDLLEQQTIAEVLSSLNDKIDLLHRQNKTLEAMAETLFRQWFVEEAEESWEIGKLGDYIQFLKGKKPNQAFETFTADLVPQILIETFDTGKTLFSEPKNMVVAKEKDILMVMDGASSGRVEIGFNGIVGSTIGLFKSKPDFNFPLFLFYFIKTNENHIQENTTGSAIPHADKALIVNLDLTYPNLGKVKEFEKLAQSWFEKKQSNKNQIRTLAKLRDELLPKLMSGDEVRVKMSEAETAAVN